MAEQDQRKPADELPQSSSLRRPRLRTASFRGFARRAPAAERTPAMSLSPQASLSDPALSRRLPQFDTALWSLIGVSALLVVAMMWSNRLPVLVASPAFAALVLILGGLAEVWRRCAPGRSALQVRLRDLSEYALLLISIGVLGAIASYQLACLSSGFHDATLQSWDRALHFDWVGWYRFTVRYRVLQLVGSGAYNSAFLSPWAIIIWHAWKGERGHARDFLLTFWLGATITLALFPLMPARGALDYLWHAPVPYSPSNGLDQGLVIEALRAHAIPAIDLASVTGLVSAPSFHTVCGVVFIASAWRIPPLRIPLVPLNLVLLAATPVEGSHYVSDMLIGAVIAIFSLTVVHNRAALLRRARTLVARKPIAALG